MYKPLVPCPSCSRHVRTSENDCPFCSATLPDGLASRAVPAARQRLSRAAAFVFTATIATSVVGAAACSGDVDDGSSSSDDSDGTSDGFTDDGDDGIGVAEYGAPVPPPDAGPDDDGGMQSKYGAPVPPEDGGLVEDSGLSDDGGGSADYGAPPPTDAG